MPADLTNARNAAWDAVLNWPFFDGVFLRTYKFDDDTKPEMAPHANQLPALELYPIAAKSEQFLHRQHKQILTLAFLVYTAGWNPSDPENYVSEITKALWQSAPEGEPTYIQTATGAHPLPNLDVDFERGHLPGNTKATLTTFQFDLKLKHDPLA